MARSFHEERWRREAVEGRPRRGAPPLAASPPLPPPTAAPGRPAPGCSSRGGLRLGSRRASPGAAGGRSIRAPCGWVRELAGYAMGAGRGAPLVPRAVLHRARRPRCALSWDRAERARVGSAFGAGSAPSASLGAPGSAAQAPRGAERRPLPGNAERVPGVTGAPAPPASSQGPCPRRLRPRPRHRHPPGRAPRGRPGPSGSRGMVREGLTEAAAREQKRGVSEGRGRSVLGVSRLPHTNWKTYENAADEKQLRHTCRGCRSACGA